MSAWLLVGWFALYPSERFSIATFATREACEERVLWFSESRKRSRQRFFQCLEVPVSPAAPELVP